MGLRSALVDSGRVLRNDPVPRRVEGSTVFVPSWSPWFKCRLELPAADADDVPTEGRRRTAHRPTVMCDLTDSEGGEVRLTSEMRLEVRSKSLLGPGVSAMFQVVADPSPIRKKRRVIGWTLNVSRVNEHPREGLAI